MADGPAVGAWARVTAKRQEHQDAGTLKASAAETQADHARAGVEWILAVCREHGLDFDDVTEAMVEAMNDSIPNLRALAAIGAIPRSQLDQAAFGGGFFSGFAIGLELRRP